MEVYYIENLIETLKEIRLHSIINICTNNDIKYHNKSSFSIIVINMYFFDPKTLQYYILLSE